MRKNVFHICLLILVFPALLNSQDTPDKKSLKKEQSNYLLEDRPWTMVLPIWLPGYAGSFAYGDISLEGEDGVDPTHPIEPPGSIIGEIFDRLFTDEWYLRFFYLTKASYEDKNFLIQLDGIYGAVGEKVKFNYNDQTVVQANYQTTNIRLLAGYRIFDAWTVSENFHYELYPYLGARLHVHRIYSELNGFINRLDISPTWVEPVLGVQNQFTWKRFSLTLQGDYGGFFIAAKQSMQLSGQVNFRVGKITTLSMGWVHLQLKHTGNFLREDYTIVASFSGPSTGISFHF